MSRVPRSLALLIAVALVQALAWMLVMPPLHGPDEVGHFSYTQKVVEAGSIPWQAIGAAPEPGTRTVSTEVERALAIAAIRPSWANISARPAGTAVDERLWDRESERLDHDDRADGGFTSSMANPPAYYLYAAVPYAVTYPASVLDRALAMRLANLPLLVALVVFCWLVAGELFGRTRWLQTVATAAVVLQPQVIHMTATVNPDIALGAIWAAALYVMIRLVRAGPSRRRLVWLAVLVAASCLTQPRGLALPIPAVGALALALWRHHPAFLGRHRRLALAGLGGAYVLGIAVIARYATGGDPSITRLRQFASYLWQFYLPRPGFMTPARRPDWGIEQAFLDRLYGGYAQLELGAPSAVLDVVGAAAVAIAVLAVVGLAVHRRALKRHWDVLVVCALAVAGYLFLVHAVAFRTLLNSPDPVVTGRYLLPLMPLFGATVALAVSWPRPRIAVGLATLALVGMSFVQLEAFGLLYERFYA